MVATKRRKTGSAVAEFGPSMFILLILVLFPMIDLLSLCVGYAYAWLLNAAELREVSVNDPAQATAAILRVDQQFLGYGWAPFLGVAAPNITHTGPTYANVGSTIEVSLGTAVSVKPFMTVPLPAEIPGLSTRVTFSFNSTVPQEENARN